MSAKKRQTAKRRPSYDEVISLRIDSKLLSRLNNCARYEIQTLPNFIRERLKDATDEYGKNGRFRKWLEIEKVEGWAEFQR